MSGSYRPLWRVAGSWFIESCGKHGAPYNDYYRLGWDDVVHARPFSDEYDSWDEYCQYAYEAGRLSSVESLMNNRDGDSHHGH